LRPLKIFILFFFDILIPKKQGKYLFVSKKNVPYSNNLRALCDYTAQNKQDNDEIYLFHEGYISEKTKEFLKKQNITLLDQFNIKNIKKIVSCSNIILSHSIRDAYITYNSKKRKIINVWHGAPIKRIENSMPFISNSKKRLIKHNAELYDILIASSDIDRLAITSSFAVDFQKVKLTGLPRYDYLFKNHSFSPDIEEEIQTILKAVNNKKFILYAPTFRENNISPLESLTTEEWREIENFLKQHNAVLGIRPHSYDNTNLSFLKSDHFIDCSFRKISEPNALLRYTDLLIVDFSSIWIDYLLLNRPIHFFSKDLDTYQTKERDFLYDFKKIIPAPLEQNISGLLNQLNNTFENNLFEVNYTFQKMLFHQEANSEFTKNTYKKVFNIE
jgi:CDP-glycerol glycerophosphotransferase (TagB/SpsB family)